MENETKEIKQSKEFKTIQVTFEGKSCELKKNLCNYCFCPANLFDLMDLISSIVTYCLAVLEGAGSKTVIWQSMGPGYVRMGCGCQFPHGWNALDLVITTPILCDIRFCVSVAEDFVGRMSLSPHSGLCAGGQGS